MVGNPLVAAAAASAANGMSMGAAAAAAAAVGTPPDLSLAGGDSSMGGSSTPQPGGGPNVMRPISPATIQCGISDDELVSLSVRDLNRALKMRGLTRDEIVTMKQR